MHWYQVHRLRGLMTDIMQADTDMGTAMGTDIMVEITTEEDTPVNNFLALQYPFPRVDRNSQSK